MTYELAHRLAEIGADLGAVGDGATGATAEAVERARLAVEAAIGMAIEETNAAFAADGRAA